MRDRVEVCPLSRGVMLPCGAAPIRTITARHSLFPASLTRTSFASPYGWLTLVGGVRAYRVRLEQQNGLGPLSPPVVLLVRVRHTTDPEPTTVPFGSSPCSILGLLHRYGVYRAFACADHTIDPRPYPPDAGRSIFTSRVGCRSFDRGILCRRVSSTARYLAASPPKGTADGTAGSIALASVEQLLVTLCTSHVVGDDNGRAVPLQRGSE